MNILIFIKTNLISSVLWHSVSFRSNTGCTSCSQWLHSEWAYFSSLPPGVFLKEAAALEETTLSCFS